MKRDSSRVLGQDLLRGLVKPGSKGGVVERDAKVFYYAARLPFLARSEESREGLQCPKEGSRR